MTTLFSQKISLIILGLIVLFGSCSTDDNYEIRPPSADEVKFEIGFAQSENQLRTTTDGSYNTTFNVGDAIGVFAVKRVTGTDSPLLSSGNYIHNLKLTLQADGRWLPETPIYYHQGGGFLDFYAYYPYDANATDPTNLNFEVKANQKSDEDFANSDFLTASAYSQTKGAVVSLSFSHAMALVVVEVTNGSGGARLDSTGVVKLENVIRAKNANNLETWAYTMGAGNQTVIMNRVKSTDPSKSIYRALVPSQMMTPISFVSFTQDYTSRYTLDPFFINPGFTQKLSVTLVSPILKHVYAVGDVFPYTYPSEPAVGVVCSVSNGGKSGTIISLDEAELIWSNGYFFNSITDMNDGFVNKQQARRVSTNLSSFPGMKWCEDKGSDWYLPAVNELKAISSSLSVINTSLRKLSSPTIGEEVFFYYATSTEIDQYSAYSVIFKPVLIAEQDGKENLSLIRAMRKF